LTFFLLIIFAPCIEPFQLSTKANLLESHLLSSFEPIGYYLPAARIVPLSPFVPYALIKLNHRTSTIATDHFMELGQGHYHFGREKPCYKQYGAAWTDKGATDPMF
jgi:hypothetical protein